MKTIRLRVLLCFVILFLIAGRAQAANWVPYGSSSLGDSYYDQNSVVRVHGNMTRVLTKTIFNDVGKLKNYSELKKQGKAPGNPYLLSYEFVWFDLDCRNAKIRVSARRICDKRGNVIASGLNAKDPWTRVVPRSPVEKLKNEVCQATESLGVKKK